MYLLYSSTITYKYLAHPRDCTGISPYVTTPVTSSLECSWPFHVVFTWLLCKLSHSMPHISRASLVHSLGLSQKRWFSFYPYMPHISKRLCHSIFWFTDLFVFISSSSVIWLQFYNSFTLNMYIPSCSSLLPHCLNRPSLLFHTWMLF